MTQLENEQLTTEQAPVSTARKFSDIQAAFGQIPGAEQPEQDPQAAADLAMRTQVAEIGLRQNFDDGVRQINEEISGMTQSQMAEMFLDSGIDLRQKIDWGVVAKAMASATRKSDELSVETEKERQKELHTEGPGGTSAQDEAPPSTLEEGISRVKARF